MCRRSHIFWMLFALLGCEGEIGFEGDVGMAPDDVGVTQPDTAGPEPDTGSANNSDFDPLCQGVTCLPNSVCAKGDCYCAPGFMGDPAVGCVAGNPCDGVDCPFGATCDDNGECPCDPGFVDDSLGGCQAEEIVFPADRTQSEVCARWAADHPQQAVLQWQVEPVEQCDPGIIDPAFQLDAVRRVSLYRWLVGLPAVTTREEYARWTQACATLLAAEDRGVAITVDATLTCHSADASAGAAGSNLLRGPTSAAESVDIYMEDDGVTDLSHRRWILNPHMGSTAFGSRGRYSCMYALDDDGEAAPMFVAYPFGVFPDQALLGPWSFGSETLGLGGASVTITDGNGTNVPVSNTYVASGNFGIPTLAWSVEGAAAPNTYNVTITGLTGSENEVTYTVQLVTCP